VGLGADGRKERALNMIQFADGLAEFGYPGDLPSRLRVIADDVLELVEELAATASALTACQANYDRCLNVLGQRAYDAAAREAAARE
jgi:hypothetical protein